MAGLGGIPPAPLAAPEPTAGVVPVPHVSATAATPAVRPDASASPQIPGIHAAAVTRSERDALAFRLAASGRTCREIGEALGVHHSTAARSIRREADRRALEAQDGLRDAGDREILRSTLMGAIREAWAVSRAPEAKPRTRVAALRAIGVLCSRASRLLGLDSLTVRHEHERLMVEQITIEDDGRIMAQRISGGNVA